MLVRGFVCAKFAETQLRLQDRYENSNYVVVLICGVERGIGGWKRSEHADKFAGRAATADPGETAHIDSVCRRRRFVPGVLCLLSRKERERGWASRTRSKGHRAEFNGDREEQWR